MTLRVHEQIDMHIHALARRLGLNNRFGSWRWSARPYVDVNPVWAPWTGYNATGFRVRNRAYGKTIMAYVSENVTQAILLVVI